MYIYSTKVQLISEPLHIQSIEAYRKATLPNPPSTALGSHILDLKTTRKKKTIKNRSNPTSGILKKQNTRNSMLAESSAMHPIPSHHAAPRKRPILVKLNIKFNTEQIAPCLAAALGRSVQIIIEKSSFAFRTVNNKKRQRATRTEKERARWKDRKSSEYLKPEHRACWVEGYRLSTRLSAPSIRPRSSRARGRVTLGARCPLSFPSMARRCCVFNASRSSRRWAQMRSIREDTASAVERYSSMSWIPAAKVSSVGARPVVIRERRAETAEGGMGG